MSLVTGDEMSYKKVLTRRKDRAMRLKGEPPHDTRSAADDATRIIPIADNSIAQTQLVPNSGVGGSEGRGAIIGSAKRSDSDQASSSTSGEAPDR